MNHIKSMRNFVIAIISTVVLLVCLVLLLNSYELRFIGASIVLLLYAVINFILAFSKKGDIEECKENMDERDVYITMRSGHMTLKILNYLLATGCFINVILYGAFKNYLNIVISIALCSVEIAMFTIMLCVNIYYERNK